MTGERPLLIADVPWLLYRSFFALPKSIVGSGGRPVNALLGTANALLAAVGVCSPRAVAACTGAEEAVYRVKLYAPYHAHRDPMPEALAEQWQEAPRLLEALGFAVTSGGELEADDVMFSYAREELRAGGSALLLSADRDMFAVVGDRVSILELSREGKPTRIGPDEVRERYGVGPELVADFIALRGDPSDGIPGAPGVGAKTAAALLREHGSLERTLEAAHSPVPEGMSPRVAAALADNDALLRTFKEVATLQQIALARPADAGVDHVRGATAARSLGMNALADRLEESAARRGSAVRSGA